MAFVKRITAWVGQVVVYLMPERQPTSSAKSALLLSAPVCRRLISDFPEVASLGHASGQTTERP